MSRTNENKLKMKDIATIGIFPRLLIRKHEIVQ